MPLWSDLIQPSELTGFARRTFDQFDVNQGSLQPFLPNQLVPDLVVKVERGQNQMVDVASYRSFDAESPISSGPGLGSAVFQLAPLAVKERISEYDQLRARAQDTNETVLNSVLRVTARRVKSMADRIDLARGQALVQGKVIINENGFSATADYGRTAGNTVTAGTLWSNSSSSPLGDLQTWSDYLLNLNGAAPGAIIASRRILVALRRHPEFRSFFTNAGAAAPPFITAESVNGVIGQEGYPGLTIFDKSVRVAGVQQRIIPDNVIVMLPTDGSLGATFWGQTLEASDPMYGIGALERPGIVVGVHKTYDPIGLWVHAAAIGLPTLANPDSTLVATVL